MGAAGGGMTVSRASRVSIEAGAFALLLTRAR